MKIRGLGKYARCLAPFLFAVLLLISALPAGADNIRMDVIPALRLEEGWWSNVNNTADGEISSAGTRVVPGLGLRFSSPDNVVISVTGNYERVWYYDSEADDSNYNTWFVRVDSTGGWMLTPTLSMQPSVYYVNTTNSYRRTQLVPSGDPIVPPVSITNYGDTKTTDFGGGLNFSYAVSPRFSVNVAGNYTKQTFDTPDNTAATDLTDSSQATVGASFTYLFSPRTRLGPLFAWSHQDFTNAPSAETYTAGLVYNYAISHMFNLELAGGVSYVRQEAFAGQKSDDDVSPSGVVNLSYVYETFNANLYGSYVFSGGSGFGEITRQGSVGFMMSDRFTENWTWTLSATYQNNKSVFDEAAVKIDTIYCNAGLRYQMWEWGSLDLVGNFNHQESKGQLGSTLDNYSVVLGITVGKAYNLF